MPVVVVVAESFHLLRLFYFLFNVYYTFKAPAGTIATCRHLVFGGDAMPSRIYSFFSVLTIAFIATLFRQPLSHSWYSPLILSFFFISSFFFFVTSEEMIGSTLGRRPFAVSGYWGITLISRAETS